MKTTLGMDAAGNENEMVVVKYDDFGIGVDKDGNVHYRDPAKSMKYCSTVRASNGVRFVKHLLRNDLVCDLVMQAFGEPAPSSAHMVCHVGDISDDSIDNLIWDNGTRAENEKFSVIEARNEIERPMTRDFDITEDIEMACNIVGISKTKDVDEEDVYNNRYMMKDVRKVAVYSRRYRVFVAFNKDIYRHIRKSKLAIRLRPRTLKNSVEAVKVPDGGWVPVIEIYNDAYLKKEPLVQEPEEVLELPEKVDSIEDVGCSGEPESVYLEDWGFRVYRDGRVFRQLSKDGDVTEATWTREQPTYSRRYLGRGRRYVRQDLIVATAYCANPTGSTRIEHLDGNIDNCHADNLRWKNSCRRPVENAYPKYIQTLPEGAVYNELANVYVTRDGAFFRACEEKGYKQIMALESGGHEERVVCYEKLRFNAAMLVAVAFIPNPKKLEFLRFRDNDPANLDCENLYWSNSCGKYFARCVDWAKAILEKECTAVSAAENDVPVVNESSDGSTGVVSGFVKVVWKICDWILRLSA